MRRLAVVIVGVVLGGWTAAAAVAQSTTVAPPEVPPTTGTVFVDDPSILDPHPMAVESWSRLGAGDALALHFTSGTPECYGVTATVHESGGRAF